MMFTQNPFSGLAANAAGIIQGFVILMIVFVAGGTLYDMLHKGSARYFFANRAAQQKGERTREIPAGEKVALASGADGERSRHSPPANSAARGGRLAHLLTMYGFLAYVISTIIMVFVYPTSGNARRVIVPCCGIGALMVCIGGYWFWFFIRVDVVGRRPFAVARHARRSVHRFAAREHDAGADLGLSTVEREALDDVCARSLSTSPRRSFSDRYRGRNSRTCSTSRPPRSRNVSKTPTATRSQSAAAGRCARDARQRPHTTLATTETANIMPTFVYMTKCDGCGYCVDICPSDIMHIDETYRRAVNIEPNMCWECYSCVKACPQNAIDVRGYADFAPLGHSVRALREEERARSRGSSSSATAAKRTSSPRSAPRHGARSNRRPNMTRPAGRIEVQELAHEPDALNIVQAARAHARQTEAGVP